MELPIIAGRLREDFLVIPVWIKMYSRRRWAGLLPVSGMGAIFVLAPAFVGVKKIEAPLYGLLVAVFVAGLISATLGALLGSLEGKLLADRFARLESRLCDLEDARVAT